MAKLKYGIFGPISGKVGPVIGGTWKETHYLRESNRPNKARPLSEAQMLHLRKFKFTTQWLRPFHPYISVGYRNLAKANTEINLAFSHHFKNAVVYNGEEFAVNYEKVQISSGHLKGIYETQLSRITPNSLSLTWVTKDERFSYHNDQLMLVIYNEDLGLLDGVMGGVGRGERRCQFTFNPNWAEHRLHVYVAWYTVNGKEVSETQYLGKLGAL